MNVAIAGRPYRSDAKHLYTLDAIRGIAALVVFCLHEFQAFPGLPHPHSGYLAVDLFFLLSGYVIAGAYDDRLRRGMTLGTFLSLRLIRLYPLYLIGFAIGVVRVVAQIQVGTKAPPVDAFALGSLLELVMLPTPMTIGWSFDTPFFVNPPAWSLFFELLANVCFAVFHKHLSKRVLLALLALSGVSLVWAGIAHGSLEIGNYWHTVPLSIPRVAFPFLLGVFINRHMPKLPSLHSAWTWPLTLAILPLLAWHPIGYQATYDLVLVMCVFPAVVYVGTAIQTNGLTTSVSKMAGELSYALYIVHMPLISLLLAVLRRVAPDWPLHAYAGPVVLLLSAAFALVLDRFYDRPVRRWLSRLIAPAGTQSPSVRSRDADADVSSHLTQAIAMRSRTRED
jgi:peptidoglycan/LPS O-acetylase OafA/YrhL